MNLRQCLAYEIMLHTMKDLLSHYFLYFSLVLLLGLCGLSGQALGQSASPSPKAPQTADTISASATPLTQATAFTTSLVTPAPTTVEATAPAKETVTVEPTPLATPAVQANQDAQVTLLNQAVFYIYADHNLYSAAQRAQLITERLKPLLQNIEEHPIEVIYRNEIAVLLRNKQELMTVTQADAQAAQLSLSQLSEYYAQKLQIEYDWL